MKLSLTTRFLRNVKSLSPEQRKQMWFALHLFEQQPFHPSLKNHALHGKRRGIRSLSAGYDLRILYRTEREASIAIFFKVGTHDEVY